MFYILFIFLWKRMDKTDYYKNRNSKVFMKKPSLAQERIEYILFDLLHFDRNWRYDFLELWSWIWNSIFYLAKKYPNIQFHGIEINKYEVDFLKQKVLEEGLSNVYIYQWDATGFDVKKQFDFVYSEQVIEHVENQRWLVNNMIKHLNKNWKFFISTVSYNCPFEFHIKLPFITWLSKDNAIKFMNFVWLRKKAEYYENVFPIIPKDIHSFSKSSWWKNIEYISHKIPLRYFSKNILIRFFLSLYNIFFIKWFLIKFHENFFPWLWIIWKKN